jgi:hypothetical protein
MDPHTALHLGHLLILGPFLFALGAGYLTMIPSMAIAILGVGIIGYHAFRAYTKFAAGGNPWVNLIHALLVGPALVAYHFTDARYVRELIMMLGFAAVGYHGYYLLQQ